MNEVTIYKYNSATDSNDPVESASSFMGRTLQYPASYWMVVSTGGSATEITVSQKCAITVQAGARAGELDITGLLQADGGELSGVTVRSGGQAQVSSGACVTGMEVESGGTLQMKGGTVVGLELAGDTRLSVSGDSTIGNLTLHGDDSIYVAYAATLTLAGAVEGRLAIETPSLERDAIVVGTEAEELEMSVTAPWGRGPSYGTHYLFSGDSSKVRSMTLSLTAEDGASLVEFIAGKTLVVTQDLKAALGVASLEDGVALQVADSLEISVDFGADVGRLLPLNCGVALSVWNAPAVPVAVVASMRGVDDTLDETEWTGGTLSGGAPSVVKAEPDGIGDVLFAQKQGVWSGTAYMAENTFTGARASLAGKNRFGDILLGAGDTTALVLTDTENGDAFFADDIHTAFPGEEQKQSRLAGVDAIYAGAGNDLVDLTCCNFDEVQAALAIYGGDGNDILWGGAAGARLFGDEGDDSLCGGTGDDILCGGAGDDVLKGLGGSNVYAFGMDWGNDVVQLTAGEEFRLWFDEGISVSSKDFSFDGETKMARLSCAEGTLVVTGLSGMEELEGKLLVGGENSFAGWTYDALKNSGAFASSVTGSLFAR